MFDLDPLRHNAAEALAVLHPIDRREIAELADDVRQAVWVHLDAKHSNCLTTALSGAIAAACEHIITRILAEDCAAVVAEQAEGQTA